MDDLYPSRDLPKPTIEPRKDPVLWASDDARGPLNPDQLTAFDENGFLFFERFFSEAEVAGFLREFDRLKSREDLKGDPKLIREPDSTDVRSIFCVHQISPLYARLAADPRLTSIMRQILDSDVYIHQSRINLKPGFAGKEFYWHSDFETWHVEDGMPRMRAVSCAITLSENNEFNGALMLVPGSHKQFVACPGHTPEDHYQQSLRRQAVGVPDEASLLELVRERGLVAPKGPAGCLLLFESNTMHGSNSNISPYPRSNIFFCYNSMENRLVEPFGGMKPRPEYIANRDFAPLPDHDQPAP